MKNVARAALAAGHGRQDRHVLTVADLRLEAVPEADVLAGDLRPFGPYVARAVQEELRAEGLPLDVLGRFDADVHIAKTASRAILGHMNEIAVHLRYQIGVEGGLDACATRVLNHRQRRTLHNRGGVYSEPLDLVAGRLATRS